jgi:hypothetical protein
MNSADTSITGTLRAVCSFVATSLFFWIALIGFLFSIWGSLLTHEPLYGFGYGFFGVILASNLFVAWKHIERDRSRLLRRQPRTDKDFD